MTSRMKAPLIGLSLWLMVPVVCSAQQAGYKGLDLAAFANQVIEAAVTEEAALNHGPPDQMVEYAWKTYLSQPEVVKEADARTLFKALTAVITKLSAEQRQAFAHLFYEVRFKEDSSPTAQDLVLMGWCLVNSGLSHQDGSYPAFADAVLAYAYDKDGFNQEAISLLEGIEVDRDRLEAAMVTYLNPFWHESIRDRIDDSACPFYRYLLSPSPVKWDYAAAYFMSMAINDEATRARSRKQLVDEATGAPRKGLAEVLTWSYNSNKIVLAEGLPKRLDFSDPDWNRFLEDRIEDTSLSGDVRARWALIRAYAAESSLYYPAPLVGREWIERGIALAESESARSACVASLALRLSALRQFTEASSLLEAEVAATQDDELSKRLSGTLETVQRERALYDEWQTEMKYKIAVQGIIGRLGVTRKRIERAHKRGESPEVIATFERALVSIKQQLFEIEQKHGDTPQP